MVPHKPKKSLWKRFKEYFDKIEEGTLFSRKNLLTSVYGLNYTRFYLRKKGITTLDNYRALLTKCGFIEITEKRGLYKKVKHLPENLKYIWIVRAASDDTWKKWFMKSEDWVKSHEHSN